MPKARASKAPAAVPLRVSSRKRKLDSFETDEVTPILSSKHVRKSTDVVQSTDSVDRTETVKRQTSPTANLKVEKLQKTVSQIKKKAPTRAEKIASSAIPNHSVIEDSGDPVSNSRTVKTDASDAQQLPKARKRKTKEEKEAEAMPLAARTTGLKMFVGAHVSIAKGVENAISNCSHIGGNAFALFLKSQRKWDNPPLKDENRKAFRQQCISHKYDSSSHIVPHGSYLVNLATPDKDKAKQAYDAFLDDLKRCEALGIKYYNFHPGATNKEPLPEAIGRIADNLNRALSETKTVVPLLENMAGSGSVIGSRFSDLRDIIAAIKPEFKSRIGICIDTCHAFAAGYDLRTPEAFSKTFQELDDVVGLKYLKAMHINDSKAPFLSKRDLHQNIGAGFLGLRAFHNVMNDARLENIPLILETPCERPAPNDLTGKKTLEDKNVWAREIKLLESLIGMPPESEEFKKLEQDLSDRGKAERAKMEASIAAKEEKANKKLEKERAKGQKGINELLVKSDTCGKKGAKRKEADSESDSEISESSDR